MEDEITHKPQILLLGRLYSEERERRKFQVSIMQERKHKKGLVTEEMTSGQRF